MKKEYVKYILLTPDGKFYFERRSGIVQRLRRDTYLLDDGLLYGTPEGARYYLNQARESWREERARKYGAHARPGETPRQATARAKANLAALRWVRPYPVKITVEVPHGKAS